MPQMIIDIGELKAQLTSYVQQVKAGATLIITEQDKPIGRLVPIKPSAEVQMQEWLQPGLAAWSGRKLESKSPVIRTRGKQTVADLLLEDRK